ncbi:MAG: hypothetical protein ABF979_16210 [Gluconobacter sp.]|uniref:hypothetical protein n=1 Tax=Gluconobacter sp. TaxID=1876758 RepID=UPI0039E9F9C4
MQGALLFRDRDRSGYDRRWRRYLDAANLALDTDRQIKGRTISGLSRIVTRVLRTPLLPTGDVA